MEGKKKQQQQRKLHTQIKRQMREKRNNDYRSIQSITIVEFEDSLGIVFFASKNPPPWDCLLHPTPIDIYKYF